LGIRGDDQRRRLVEFGDGKLDWVGIASSMGVRACSVRTREDFSKALNDGLLEGGPCLIEAALHG
jgi:thiamine pyrophosphate-dependent acetolactate synthase large subunit-like protein